MEVELIVIIEDMLNLTHSVQRVFNGVVARYVTFVVSERRFR